jgi:hypothetical protein
MVYSNTKKKKNSRIIKSKRSRKRSYKNKKSSRVSDNKYYNLKKNSIDKFKSYMPNVEKTIQDHVNDIINPTLMQNIQTLMLAADPLHFEIGGYFDTISLKLVPIVRAESDMIYHMPSFNYPLDPRIGFHTHPSFSTNQFNEGEYIPICLPSHTDLLTILKASIFYKQIFPEFVFSKDGIIIYQVNINLLNQLNTYTEEEQKEIINEYIYENIGSINGRLINLDDDKLAVSQFIRDIGQVFNWIDRKTTEEGFSGFDVFYIPFESVPTKIMNDNALEIIPKLINLPIG